MCAEYFSYFFVQRQVESRILEQVRGNWNGSCLASQVHRDDQVRNALLFPFCSGKLRLLLFHVIVLINILYRILQHQGTLICTITRTLNCQKTPRTATTIPNTLLSSPPSARPPPLPPPTLPLPRSCYVLTTRRTCIHGWLLFPSFGRTKKRS